MSGLVVVSVKMVNICAKKITVIVSSNCLRLRMCTQSADLDLLLKSFSKDINPSAYATTKTLN